MSDFMLFCHWLHTVLAPLLADSGANSNAVVVLELVLEYWSAQVRWLVTSGAHRISREFASYSVFPAGFEFEFNQGKLNRAASCWRNRVVAS